MTNQEAIKILDNLKPGDYSNPYEKGEAIVMAISALYAQELSKNSPKLDKENGELQPTCNQLATDVISRQAAIDAYIMKCPYFAGKNTINRSNIGTHIGSCDLEHHYRKVCPSNECICAERLGLKNE